MISPSDPGQEGNSETYQDGMSAADHKAELHGDSQSEDGGSGSKADSGD